jgi:hypothetical protein
MSYAQYMFNQEGMVRHAGPNGFFVVDRFNMRDAKHHKNMRHAYQVLSPDQSQYKLFRSLKDACEFANNS